MCVLHLSSPIVSRETDTMCRELPSRYSAFEQFIQLGISSIFHLWNLKEDDDNAKDAETNENEPTLAAKISLVSVEHVWHGEIEEPREEGVDHESETLRFGSKFNDDSAPTTGYTPPTPQP